ncbi:MAG: glycosyltransferase family 2 protein [Lachnospiraceae bacterium]|nr:glycosyltransferase family 2 protein [Lachnospiraceae bacterium]
MLYSIVIPCYRSDQTIRKVVELTMKQFETMGLEPEFVLVDDCSPDGGKTVEQLRSLVRDYENVRVVELAKNAGQHNAVMAGLNYVRGDVIIAMDDDMQTHPSQIPILLEELEKGYDIVYGYYEKKEESPFRNFGSYVNYMTTRILLKKPKEMKTSSFWVIRRFVRDYAVEYQNAFTHLQGVFLRITRNVSCIPIQHFKREVGTSNYTLKKLLQLWSNIIGFSVVPLEWATGGGVVLAMLGFVLALFTFVHKLMRPQVQIGYSSLMAALCFFSGVNLFFVGLIGNYIGKILLGISNNPQFVVRQVDEHGKKAWVEYPDGVRLEEAARPAEEIKEMKESMQRFAQ